MLSPDFANSGSGDELNLSGFSGLLDDQARYSSAKNS
jgi:hypothetical protein